jgi:HlyD family secretion protein
MNVRSHALTPRPPLPQAVEGVTRGRMPECLSHLRGYGRIFRSPSSPACGRGGGEERSDEPGVRALLGAGITLLLLAACAKPGPDAYGNFEATEVVVSSEAGGQLVRLAAREGDRLPAGAVVGQVDTALLALQKQELASQQDVAVTRTTEAAAQIGVLRAQLVTAQEEYARTQRLYRAEAATAQQLDRAEGEVRVLRQRIEAAQAQSGAARQETGGAATRMEQVGEQIRRSRVVNPVAGTVLTRYAEAGEFVQPGQPLYQIANLDTLTLRAYVSGAQLSSVRIGQAVRVRIDRSDGSLATLSGRVTWIASRAEFTPTPIQTKDERTDQVYAVKIRVPNPSGAAKIGMPAEVLLEPRSPS